MGKARWPVHFSLIWLAVSEARVWAVTAAANVSNLVKEGPFSFSICSKTAGVFWKISPVYPLSWWFLNFDVLTLVLCNFRRAKARSPWREAGFAFHQLSYFKKDHARSLSNERNAGLIPLGVSTGIDASQPSAKLAQISEQLRCHSRSIRSRRPWGCQSFLKETGGLGGSLWVLFPTFWL